MKKNHLNWLEEFLLNCKQSNRSSHTIINYHSDLKKYILWYEKHHRNDLNLANSKTIMRYKNYLSGEEEKGEYGPPEKRPFKGAFWLRLKKLFGVFLRKKGPSLALPPEPGPPQGLSVSSRRRHLSSIKNFYEFLKQSHEDLDNLFPLNPVKSKIHSIKLKEEDIESTVLLTQAHWKAINKVLYSSRDILLVNLLYWGGLRLSEVVNLKILDFDHEQKSLTFTRKGGLRHTLYIQKEAHLFHLLKIYLKARGQATSPHLFLNKFSKAISPRGMYNVIQKILTRAGLQGQGLGPHSFRKACATLLYQKTKDIIFVRDYLNHSDAKVTQTYIENTRKSLRLIKEARGSDQRQYEASDPKKPVT